jgi:hypothetical protein
MSYVEELQAWANDRVAESKANRMTNRVIKPKMLDQFKSKTSSAVYTVLDYNGRIKCNCPGFAFRRKCRHIEEMMKGLN